jgi:predicted Zn-dependent peptidase
MFYRFVLLLAFVVATPALAQKIDRSKKPDAAPLPQASFPNYIDTALSNGLRVFIIENHRQPTVTFRLVVKSGTVFDGEKPGLMSIMTELLGKGSPRRKAIDFAKEADFIGADYDASATPDATYAYISGLVKYSEKMLDLFSDAVLNPTFPNDEFELARKKALSSVTAAKKQPASLAGQLQRKVLYGDHPYGKVETEQSLGALTLDDVKNIYNAHFFSNNATIAVVGDVTVAQVMPLLEKFFGKWKTGTPPALKAAPMPTIKGTTIHLYDLPTAVQSNIIVTQPSVMRNNPDIPELGVVGSVLGGGFSGRLFANLREKHGWTYGAYATGSFQKLAGSYSASAEVRNAVTDSAIVEILAEMARIKRDTIPTQELDLQRQYIAGNYLMSLEDKGRVASRVQEMELYNLPKDYYKTYASRVGSVTPARAMDLARKYINTSDLVIIVVGNAKEVKEKLEKIAPVKVYDTDMNPVAAPMALDLSSEELLKKHMAAMGGDAALMKIKDRTTEGSASIAAGPQTINGTFKSIEKAPNKRYVQIATPMFSQESYIDGAKAVQSGLGGVRELSGDDLRDALAGAEFNELYRLAELKSTFTVKEKKMMRGKAVYVAELARASGKKETLVFDAESFLLLSRTGKQKTPQGEIEATTEFSDYRNIDGVMVAFKLTQSLGMATIELTATSVKQNTNVGDDAFVKK